MVMKLGKESKRGASIMRNHRVMALLSITTASCILLCLVNTIFLFHSLNIHSETTRLLPVHGDSVTDTSSGEVGNHFTNITDDIIVPPGKERLVQILREAKVPSLDKESIDRLPTWDQVVDLYGDSPVILGLDTCQRFRDSIDPRKAFLASAGPFNSGTNLLSELLWNNCALPKLRRKLDTYAKRWQVNWGKHQPPISRSDNSTFHNQVYKSIDNTFVLPVVAVREPYSWMQSMCRYSYAARFFRSENSSHCPNLVPSRQELEEARFVERGTNVVIRYNSLKATHDSLPDMWNDWYDDYIEADFPRVFVRVEDLVFHARNVTETVCKCAGGRLTKGKFYYIHESAKEDEIHKVQYETTLLDAMIRYGSLDRTIGMNQADQAFARNALRPDLLKMFGYDSSIAVSQER